MKRLCLVLGAALALPVAALVIVQSPAACHLQVIPDYDFKFVYTAVLRPSPRCGVDEVLRVRKSSTMNVRRNGAPYQPIKPDGSAKYSGLYSWSLSSLTSNIPPAELNTISSWRWEWYDAQALNPRTQQKGVWRAAEVLHAAP